MDADRATRDLLRPLLATGRAFYIVGAVLVSIIVLYAFVYYLQFTEGHGVSGLSTPVGSSWGLYVATIIFLIGISHVGIGVSAATRLLNLERLRPYVRIAELLTMVCLPAAVIMIAMDIGRPERFIIYVMRYGRFQSPFVWSATVISAYLVASSIYLYLSMRRDIALCAKLASPRLRWFYRLLALGYEDTEEQRMLHERVLWWMAFIILPIMVSVHSVYGLIFGLQAARPGWFNPFMAPYFVLGAVVNGFATLVIVVVVVRKVFHWEEHLSLSALRDLGRFLCWVTLIYIYFSLAEYLTYSYGASLAERTVMHSVFAGESSLIIFWPAMALLAIGYLMLLFNQTVFHHQFTLWVTFVAAILIDVVLFGTRYLIVVPSLLHPLLPYPKGGYVPSLEEWLIVVGVLAVATAAYIAFLKVFPIIELPHSTPAEVKRR